MHDNNNNNRRTENCHFILISKYLCRKTGSKASSLIFLLCENALITSHAIHLRTNKKKRTKIGDSEITQKKRNGTTYSCSSSHNCVTIKRKVHCEIYNSEKKKRPTNNNKTKTQKKKLKTAYISLSIEQDFCWFFFFSFTSNVHRSTLVVNIL